VETKTKYNIGGCIEESTPEKVGAATPASIWDAFCPLRDKVRAATERNETCDESVLKQWKDMRNRIVAQYAYLLQQVAEKMAQKIRELSVDQLSSMGVEGLYDAIDGFQPELKNKFDTYAAYRIRGAVLDSIRRDDWVPRLVRSRAKKLEKVEAKLMAKLSRKPTEEEMADAMDLPLEKYQEMLRASALRTMQSLNATIRSGDQDGPSGEMTMQDCLPAVSTHEPLDHLIHEELVSKLFGRGFTPLERRIAFGYYFEKKSMKDIANDLGLSESRVSQINTGIMEELYKRVLRNPEFFGPKCVQVVSQIIRERPCR
jgi:RNA polymerase sigma factor for flagellar operon FliA